VRPTVQADARRQDLHSVIEGAGCTPARRQTAGAAYVGAGNHP
jgi:hypothetical protein